MVEGDGQKRSMHEQKDVYIARESSKGYKIMDRELGWRFSGGGLYLKR